jgi:tetratricopeptide (TPR) repeat protein
MPFVRKKRGQVLLVHSVRDPETGGVRQIVLHVFASLPQLQSTLRPEGWKDFEKSIAWRFPDLVFDWKRLNSTLSKQARAWTEAPSGSAARGKNRTKRVLAELRHALSQLSTANARDAEVIEESRDELLSLKEDIDRLLASNTANRTGPTQATTERKTMNAATPQDLHEADRLFDQGMELWWKGNETRACTFYRKALRVDPLHADAHNHLGLRAFSHAKLAEAERHFQSAVEGGQRDLVEDEGLVPWGWVENRPYLRGLMNLSLVLRDKGLFREAIDIHERMLRLNPNDNQGVRWLLGGEYLRIGDLTRAIHAYESALDEPGCCFGLALARLQQGRPSAEVGEALLQGMAINRYIAPILLDEPWQRLDGFHGSSLAEPEWASDHVRNERDVWQRVPRSAEVLRFWWMAAPVRAWRKADDDITIALKSIAPSQERTVLVSRRFELRSLETTRELVRTVLEVS